MNFKQLHSKIKLPLFYTNDVCKNFSQEPKKQINTQINRMVKKGILIPLKRGIYIFPEHHIDEFVLSNKLYEPSYVSLESALYSYGLLAEMPYTITGITTITSKKITNLRGNYLYSKISKRLFYGYKFKKDFRSDLYYKIADPEKALLDLIYIRKIKNLSNLSINMTKIDFDLLNYYVQNFPKWVKMVIKNAQYNY